MPAIKANAVYGNGYPLFTALGRPLIAQLAVEYARKTRLRHDRPRLHRQGQRPGADRGHGRDPGAGAADDRPGALLADGPRGGDRLRPRARDPGQGRHRGRRPTRSTTTSGAAPRRAAGSRTSTTRPRTTSSSSSPGPRRRPTRPRRSRSASRPGVPVSLNGERLGLVELLERAAEIGCRHGVGIVDHIEDRIVGLKVRDIYEVPAAAIVLTAHEELEQPGRDDPPEPVQAGARPEVGLPRLRRALVGAAAHRPRRLHGRGQRPGDRRDRPAALQRQRPRRHPLLAQRRLRRRPRQLRRVRRPLLAGRLARLHRALVAAVADGAPDPRSAGRRRS